MYTAHVHFFTNLDLFCIDNARVIYRKIRYFTRSYICGPGSSVGIVTDYGLEGPGSNPGGDEILCSFRPDLRPTQTPVKWVPRLYRG